MAHNVHSFGRCFNPPKNWLLHTSPSATAPGEGWYHNDTFVEYSPADEGAARTFKIIGLGDYKLQTEPRLPIVLRAKTVDMPARCVEEYRKVADRCRKDHEIADDKDDNQEFFEELRKAKVDCTASRTRAERLCRSYTSSDGGMLSHYLYVGLNAASGIAVYDPPPRTSRCGHCCHSGLVSHLALPLHSTQTVKLVFPTVRNILLLLCLLLLWARGASPLTAFPRPCSNQTGLQASRNKVTVYAQLGEGYTPSWEVAALDEYEQYDNSKGLHHYFRGNGTAPGDPAYGTHTIVEVKCLNTAVSPMVACVCLRTHSQKLSCPNDCNCDAVGQYYRMPLRLPSLGRRRVSTSASPLCLLTLFAAVLLLLRPRPVPAPTPPPTIRVEETRRPTSSPTACGKDAHLVVEVFSKPMFI